MDSPEKSGTGKPLSHSRAHRRESLPPSPSNLLYPFREKAALLLDSGGTIRAATPSAGKLLRRPAGELADLAFGIVPSQPLRVQLDLIGPNGLREEVSVRAIPADPERDWKVVLLEEAPVDLPFGEAATLALLDVAAELRMHGLSLCVDEWPRVNAPRSLRPLLADAIGCLVGLTSPSGGVLRVRAQLASRDFISIGLDQFGGRREESGDVTVWFEQTLRRVEAAGGFLGLEVDELGLRLRLILPLAQPTAAASL